MISKKYPDYSNTPTINSSSTLQENNTTNEPLVSVIIPFYNGDQLIFETLKSIYQQTFNNFEIILVNDGSDDTQSQLILKELRTNQRLRIIDCQKNKGLSSARNTGVKNANTEFILFIDADDLIEPTCLEKWFLFLLLNPGESFVNSFTVGFGAESYLWDRTFDVKEDFLIENQVTAMMMIRKSAFLAVGGFDTNIRGGFEDWDFWLKCASKGYWGKTVPEYLTWYRRKENHSNDWGNWDGGSKQKEFSKQIKLRYKHLEKTGFPNKNQPSLDEINIPIVQRLTKKTSMIFILPWLEMGGADKFNLDLIKGLKKDYEISVLCTLKGTNDWVHEFSKHTNDIFFLHSLLEPKQYIGFLDYYIESRQPKTIFLSNSEYGYAILPYLKVKYPTIPIVDYCHMEEIYWQNGGYPKMSVDNQKFLTKSIVSTEYLKQWQIANGGNPEKIEVCYTNIDIEDWKQPDISQEQLKTELGLPAKPIIFFSGRITKQKQPFVLAKTIEKLVVKNRNFLMVVAGEGDLFEEFIHYITDQNLQSHILVLGAIDNDLVKKYLQSCDVFFLPSEHEGLALSIYEAMSCGKVVVSADVSGQNELIINDSGFLVKRSNYESESDEYAKILLSLLNDPEKANKMGQVGRSRIVKGFTINKMYSKMKSVLNIAVSTNTSIDNETMQDAFQQSFVTISQKFSELKKEQDKLYGKNGGSFENGKKALEIQDWYNKEYEVLPLWYKRLGHIIKIIMGNRKAPWKR